MKIVITIVLLCWAFLLQGQQGNKDFEEGRTQATLSAEQFISPYIDATNTQLLSVQVQAWKQSVEKTPASANGWMNYYMTSRLWYLQSNSNQLSNKAKEQLRQIAEKMDKEAAGELNSTFEKQLVRYFETKDINYNQASKYLLTAYKLNTKSTFLYPELAKYYEIESNTAQRNTFCNSITQVADNTGLYTYSDLLIESLPDGAVLFTNGEYDTYALWRAAASKSKNIKVISYGLLQNKEYREAILKKYNLKSTAYNPKNHNHYLELLVASNADKSIFISLTLPKQYISKMVDKLYLTGYAYQYSAIAIDNISSLYSNLITKATPIATSGGNQIYKNLLQGYIVLYRYYKTSNAATAKQVHERAKTLGKKAGFWSDKYEAYFK